MPCGVIIFDYLGTRDVRRHQVRRKLNSVEPKVEGTRKRLDQQGLRETWDALQKTMAATGDTDYDLPDSLFLPDDYFGDLGFKPSDDLRHPVKQFVL
jgi:hypothetical protein